MIISRYAASIIAAELKAEQKKIVFTNGCFDILHCGHTTYLHKASEMGDVLFVGVNSDASVKRLKGDSRPINVEHDRAEVLDSLKGVDFVVIFGEDTPLELIEEIKPDVLVKGGDYNIENIVGADFVKSIGGRVITIDLVEGHSTTKLIDSIKENPVG